jgi:hypothetical protein
MYVKENKPLVRSVECTRFRCAPLNALERTLHLMQWTGLQLRCMQCGLLHCPTSICFRIGQPGSARFQHDSLLNIFHLCQLVLVDEDEHENGHILQGGEWICKCWWCRLVQVC